MCARSMPTHIIDSLYLRDLYGTAEMRAVFDDLNLLQKWLDVEVALARAEAEVGVIPMYAADEIALRARAENLDPARIKKLIDETVHPIVPLIRVLADACEGDAGEYLHWGATTQDIMDTAMILQLKEAIPIIERRLAGILEALVGLATKYRDTPMAGRTHGQQALPITFGFKVAVWLAEMQRHQVRLTESKPRLLVGEFAGAVGTLASLPREGLEVQRRMMEILGLGVPLIGWHTARDGLTEFALLLGMVSATATKIAREVIALQKTELAEVEEPFIEGKIGSSTMPHKRNPMLCEAIVGLGRLIMNRAPVAFDAMIQEHERDWSGDHIEWAYLPEMSVMADGALQLLERVMRGLRVYPERMEENLGRLQGLMLSEAVMLALGRVVGRQTAHELVYKCSMQAIEERRPFSEVLAQNPIVAEHLTKDEIKELLEAHSYLGLAGTFVDRVVANSSQP